MPGKKKILFIITYPELGGAQKQLLFILRHLDREKYSLYLYTSDRGYLRDEFLETPDLNVRLEPCLKRELSFFFDAVVFLKLFFFIRRNRFDIVHIHSPKASILGRWASYLAGVKNIIYTVHGWPFHNFMNPLAYRFYLLLERLSAKITKKIIVVSKADLERGVKNKIAQSHKFSFVHYGIEREEFDRVYREREGIPCLNKIITISALKPQKGIFYFLKLAETLLKTMPELEFKIVGDGPLRKDVERKIEAMGLKGKIQLFGWVKETPDLFKESSIFILTSLWEGLPVALIEAVVSGIPVVVTNTGGVFDVMEHNRQGIVVEPADLSGIRDACLKILENYVYWNKMVRDSRDRLNLSYWSRERMIAETEDIYKQICC